MLLRLRGARQQSSGEQILIASLALSSRSEESVLYTIFIETDGS
jgi:hypothetical protein